MDYIFQINELDTAALQSQVCQALTKRAELISRAKHPKLWKRSDRVNAGKSPEEIAKKQKLRSRILSLCVIILGTFLFVPGLMDPAELMVPLMAGAAGMIVGLFTLAASFKPKKDPFEQSAKALVQGMTGIVPAKVTFTDESMTVEANDTSETTPYDRFEFVIDQPDLLLVTFGLQSVIVLPKKDLEGSVEEFLAFIEEKATVS